MKTTTRLRILAGVFSLAAVTAIAPQAGAIDVAIYHADDTYPGDVETKIDETGLLEWVFLESVTASTPSLAQLQTHDAVFVYSAEPFDDPDLMGDRLADFVDGGGSLVLAGAAFDPLLGLGIAGRLVSDGYLPLQMGLPTQATSLTLVEDLPDHALLKGVDAFDGGLMSLHHTTSLVGGATLVASWSNTQPLIAYWVPAGAGTVIGMNMGPPSGDIYPGQWDPSTDGGVMMANALLYAAGCDADDDGFFSEDCGGAHDDCDDADASRNPGLVETLDGVDNDCDGLVDEGLLPFGALIVTEVMQNPSAVGDDHGEWFEVYNTTGTPIDLYGLSVYDLGSDDFIVDSPVVVQPNSHAVLGIDGEQAANGGVVLDYEYSGFTLGNTDDEIVLEHDGVLLDSVAWDGGPGFPDPSGRSMSLGLESYDVNANDDGANWCNGVPAFGAGDLGTPGADNDSCVCVDDDADGYEASECGGDDCDDGDPTAHPGATEVCDDGIDNDCDGYYDGVDWDCPACDDNDGDHFGDAGCGGGDCDDGDPTIYPGAGEVACDYVDNDCDGALHDAEVDDDGDGFDECGADGVLGTADDDCSDLFPSIYPGAVELFDVMDNDCDGMVDEGALPAEALVITEIMKDPDVVGDDVGEWFELVNETPLDINLMGMRFYDLGSDEFVVDRDVWVEPAEYVVLGREGVQALNGGVEIDYVWSGFTLGNGADEIVVEHGGVVLDTVEYDDGVLWPDPTGASLSVDLYHYGANDDPDNWCEGVAGYGLGDRGTPGDMNPECCPDADADGFLDASCGGTDCDDADPAIHPGAEELCDGGVDNDCDEDTVEDEDLDGDGYDICSGDCDETDVTLNPGMDEVCDGVDNDCDAATDEDVDGDGDTHTICDGDCDDGDPTTYPGAPETCDGLDNDCDGQLPADEEDGDEDGVRACEGDCDDGDPTTYPGAPEQCDQLDNDCDDEVDEDVDEDTDGDGYNACQGDCDNGDPDSYPGAPELCDGADNDCDGAPADYEVDADGDGEMECEDCDDADASLNHSDADADGYTSCDDGDCDDTDAGIHPDAEEVCDGVDNDCDGDVDADDVDASADVDGDGYLSAECGGEDCDDTDHLVNPEVDEDCEDQIDNDCDGATDEADEECAEPADDDDSAPDDDDDDCECDATGRGSASGSVAVALLGLVLMGRRRR